MLLPQPDNLGVVQELITIFYGEEREGREETPSCASCHSWFEKDPDNLMIFLYTSLVNTISQPRVFFKGLNEELNDRKSFDMLGLVGYGLLI